jgi:hypothetical protein
MQAAESVATKVPAAHATQPVAPVEPA